MWLICQPSSQFFTFHLLSPATWSLSPSFCCDSANKTGQRTLFSHSHAHNRVWRDRNLTEQSQGTCRCSFSSCLRDSCQGLFIPALFFNVIPTVAFVCLTRVKISALTGQGGPKRHSAHRGHPCSCCSSCCSSSVCIFYVLEMYVYCFCYYLWLTTRASSP